MTPGSPADALPPQATESLDTLWHAALREGGVVPREQVRRSARIVAHAARASGLTPEQLLIAVKTSWAQHTEFRPLEERRDFHAVLADAVTACIHAYFEPVRDADGRTDDQAARA